MSKFITKNGKWRILPPVITADAELAYLTRVIKNDFSDPMTRLRLGKCQVT